MLPKNIFLVLFLLPCGLVHQVYGDDDECGDDLNLSLSYWLIYRENNITLQWQLRDQTECSIEYHVTITDSDLGVVQDIHTEETSTSLKGISPCVSYRFEIRAINKAIPTVEGPLITMTVLFTNKAQVAPILETLDIQATSINMTWRLQGNANRCPLKRLYIDGGKYFNQSVPLPDPEDPFQETVAVEITSLKPNSMYFFQVFVENSAGISPPTQLAVQTLELTDDNNN